VTAARRRREHFGRAAGSRHKVLVATTVAQHAGDMSEAHLVADLTAMNRDVREAVAWVAG
jgi:hypothetical protein